MGKERDGESGLYYYGARYYAAWTCRFISVDPLAADYPFYTPYNYAGNKPIHKIDIDGMQEDGGSPQQTPDKNQTSRQDNTAVVKDNKIIENIDLTNAKSPTNSYVFDEKGYYVRTEKNDKAANLVIENSKTKDRSIFEFNDPKTDVAAIEYNLKNLGEEEFKETKFVFTVSDKRIGEMMNESGVENKNYVSRRIFTATESTGGKMDFTAYHLSIETSHGANGVWDFDTELLKDKGPIFIMGDQKKAYNLFDAGNWLWGNAVNRLGGSSMDAKDWSLWNDPNDSPADQRAIQNGWFYKDGFK